MSKLTDDELDTLLEDVLNNLEKEFAEKKKKDKKFDELLDIVMDEFIKENPDFFHCNITNET